MDRREIERLTETIRAGDAAGVARSFLRSDMAIPQIAWSPDDATLDNDVLGSLLNYWRALPRETELPAVSEFRYVDMAFALGNLMVLDVIEDGWDYRYVYYGPEIIARTKSSMSGRNAAEIEPDSFLPTFLIAAYRAVVQRREPLFTAHKPRSMGAAESWRRLILPLVDEDDGNVSRILVGTLPGRWQVQEQLGRSAA